MASVRVVPGCPTGHALIVVDDAGESSIVFVTGANATFDLDDLHVLESAGSGDIVLLQLEIPPAVVTAAARRASARSARVILNLAPYAVPPPDVAALADPFVVNEQEALLLADSQASPSSLLVTFGAAGAAWDGCRLTGPRLSRPRCSTPPAQVTLSVAL